MIRAYRTEDAPAFRALNLAWIEAHFTVEPEDLAQLDDPHGHILAKGGRILIAEEEGEAVGTLGLVPAHEPGTLELIKMAVRADQQGRGIGMALMQAAIAAAREMGARRIWLETNASLKPALAVYRKAGFRVLEQAEWTATPYSRCNCQMEMRL